VKYWCTWKILKALHPGYISSKNNGQKVHVKSSDTWINAVVKLFQWMICHCGVSLSKQQLGVRAKTCWLGIKIMCLSGATGLPANCCFSELALMKSNWSSTKRTSSINLLQYLIMRKLVYILMHKNRQWHNKQQLTKLSLLLKSTLKKTLN
jgi:hypothetical protein